MQQRLPKVQDTRPHRDAGHQTEIVKRLAASVVQDSKTPASSCVLVLDGPTTRVNSRYAKAHTVQDQSIYNEYTAGQTVAESELRINAKASQINPVCYSSTAVPEYNDLLRTDTQAALKQAAKNAYQRGYSTAACCQVCGKPPMFSRGCACSLTVAQQSSLKDKVGNRLHTSIPNA